MPARRKRLEVIRIFRYFTGVAMVYFAALSLFTAWETGEIINLSQIQSLTNLVINAILFGYLSWSWLENKLTRYYLPFALVAATILPLFTNLIYLADPMESAQMTITRSWFLFPILIVPLALIAWQYRFRVVLAFIFLITILELSTLVPRVKTINYETLPILGLPLIRAFAFGTVSHVITRLIATQREQQRKLVEANIKLNEHANTLEQLTISRERNRLARDLHDTLAHTLSGLTVNLEATKILLGEGHPEVTERLDHALQNTRDGLTDTRRALKDLRVKQVEDLGLKLALENLYHQASAQENYSLELDLPEILPETSIQIEQVYYRIAQESLVNIIKHAEASSVSLHLFVDDSKYTMIIEDDGKGFNPDQQTGPNKLGLKGMMERAAECGCKLTIASRPGRGSTITLITELHHVQNPDL